MARPGRLDGRLFARRSLPAAVSPVSGRSGDAGPHRPDYHGAGPRRPGGVVSEVRYEQRELIDESARGHRRGVRPAGRMVQRGPGQAGGDQPAAQRAAARLRSAHGSHSYLAHRAWRRKWPVRMVVDPRQRAGHTGRVARGNLLARPPIAPERTKAAAAWGWRSVPRSSNTTAARCLSTRSARTAPHSWSRCRDSNRSTRPWSGSATSFRDRPAFWKDG